MKNHLTNHKKHTKDGGDKGILHPTLCGKYISIHSFGTMDNTDSDCKICNALYKNPLKIEILSEEITISTIRDEIEVVHWVEDEWIEDPTILPAIANAIHLAHTAPDKLIHMNFAHMSSQYDIRNKR